MMLELFSSQTDISLHVYTNPNCNMLYYLLHVGTDTTMNIHIKDKDRCYDEIVDWFLERIDDICLSNTYGIYFKDAYDSPVRKKIEMLNKIVSRHSGNDASIAFYPF